MTMPLALDWLRISTWLLIGAIFWNEAWPLDWLDVLALGSLLLVWFDARLRALDLDIRFETLDLNIRTVSRFYCLPFWYSDTLVQSGLLVQERLNVDLWMSWCRFCTAISHLDIFVAVRTLNLDWCNSILVEAFLLSFRTLVDCSDNDSTQLWYSYFESVTMDYVQSPQWHPLNWNKSQLHNREFGPHPWRWKWISIIHFDTYILNP